ncbi:MAG: ATP-binding protein [Proteobacteria bacterium]|nr:ATP-binding protein [Pseudomonadota bacterium]
MIYLLHSFNPHWEGNRPPEWEWPKRRIYHKLTRSLDNPLLMNLGGLRKTGKTTLLKQLLGRLVKSGTPPRRTFYFQFDRDLVVRHIDILKRVLDAYLLDFLGTSIGHTTEKTYIFLDEIQMVPRGAEIIQRYADRDPALKFVVSASSSAAPESIQSQDPPGGFDRIHINPPDFRDYLIVNNIESPPSFPITSDLRRIPMDFMLYYGKNKSRLSRLYLQYLRWGGFPQLKEITGDDERRDYIEDAVVKKILRYDLPARFSGDNPIDLERLYYIYSSEYGQMVEFKTLSKDMHVSVERLKKMSTALAAGFLVQFCFNHTISGRKSGRTGKKVYLNSPSLAAYRHGPLERFPEAMGRLVENDIFLRLREKDDALTFWRVERQEIDFRWHVDEVVIPVECKTGRPRTSHNRLMRSLTKKWDAPFAIMITSDTLDFSDPSVLKVPAFLM